MIRLDLQEITLADLFHLPYGALLPAQGIDVLESGKYPNVTRCVPLQHTLVKMLLTKLRTLGGGRRFLPARRGRRSTPELLCML